MALSAGSVTVNGDGTYSGSGLALAIFESFDTWAATEFGGSYTGALRLQQRQNGAKFAGYMATPLVTYITANAVVTTTIHTSDSALQRTPNPNNPDTNTQGPSGNKTLTGTVG